MHESESTALLSAEDIKEFQLLLRPEFGEELSADQTRLIVGRVLRFYRLCETAGKTPRPAERPEVLLGGRPATQRALETEATLALRTLQEHLAHVEQRPSTWRWAIVALHAALKYSLQARLVAELATGPLPDSLPVLFGRVSEIMPELPQVAETVENLDVLRWKYLARQLSVWPVTREHLPELLGDALRVIQRLRGNGPDALMVSLSMGDAL